MRDPSIQHIVLVAYLYPPCNVVPAHRPAGFRRAFELEGIRTTVLTSRISGSYDDDAAQRIIRAGDLRTRFQTQYQTLVGYRDGGLDARAKPRWWTNYIVPDPTALAWFPQALTQLLKLIKNDRPDLVVTTSGPESAHLLGLVASSFGIRWVADYRDGWLRDVRHPAVVRPLDRLLERLIAHRSTVVTAVNDAIAAEIADRHGLRAFTISNGFDRTAIAGASDERSSVEPTRFSLVHTGSLAIDVEGPVVHRGRDAETFLDALRLLLARDESWATSLELVVAGRVSEAEREILTCDQLGKIVRVSGLLPHARALGLQQAADGLLLIPGGTGATTAKVFEYLAARKPIFAVTQRDSVAADLLREAGEHTIADPGDAVALAEALHGYLTRWSASEPAYGPNPGFDLESYDYESLGRKLLQLIAVPDPGTSSKLSPEERPEESGGSRLKSYRRAAKALARPAYRSAKRLISHPVPDSSSAIAIGSLGGFQVAYREGTADESVIGHSFDNDIFFSGFPEYRPAEGDVIVDVGAHIGTFSLLAASKVRAGQVFAAEASLDSFNLLRINLALNHCHNVEAHHLALSDNEGTCVLFHDVGNWGHSTVASLSTSSEAVDCCTLGQFFDRNRIEHCTFMKMNCEGSEFPILLSAPESVLGRIENALVLYHCDLWTKNGEGDLISHLEACGFHCEIRNRSEKRGWLIATRAGRGTA